MNAGTFVNGVRLPVDYDQVIGPLYGDNWQSVADAEAEKYEVAIRITIDILLKKNNPPPWIRKHDALK